MGVSPGIADWLGVRKSRGGELLIALVLISIGCQRQITKNGPAFNRVSGKLAISLHSSSMIVSGITWSA